MVLTRTLAQLRDEIADEADIAPISATSFVTTDQLTRMVNQAVRKMADLILQAGGEQHWEKVHTFATVDGAAQYALPADFYRDYLVSATMDGETFPLRKATPDMLERDSTLTAAFREVIPGYRIVGSQLELAPIPHSVMTIKMRYIPTLFAFNSGGSPVAELSADTDYIDGVNGWEDFVIYDACVRVAIREERDAATYAAFRDEAQRRIVEGASERTGEPDRVRRVFARGGLC